MKAIRTASDWKSIPNRSLYSINSRSNSLVLLVPYRFLGGQRFSADRTIFRSECVKRDASATSAPYSVKTFLAKCQDFSLLRSTVRKRLRRKKQEIECVRALERKAHERPPLNSIDSLQRSFRQSQFHLGTMHWGSPFRSPRRKFYFCKETNFADETGGRCLKFITRQGTWFGKCAAGCSTFL